MFINVNGVPGIIGSGTDYYTIENFSLAVETDVASASVPISTASVDIVTTDEIKPGGFATFADEVGTSYFKGRITKAVRIAPGKVRLELKSFLAELDQLRHAAVLYEDEEVVYTLELLLPEGYTVDSSFTGARFSGFAPEQSKRERLAWLLFAVGGYVCDWGPNQGTVLPIDETPLLVPLGDTYKRPEVTHKDYVTAVRATAFSFTEGTPAQGDETVTDGETTYIVHRTVHTLTNSRPPAGTPDNIIDASGVMFINADNVDDVLSRMAKYYFPPPELSAGILNNGSFWPGQKLQIYADKYNLVSGYADRMDFRAGKQAMSTVRLTACAEAESAPLVLRYLYQGAELARRTYQLPVGYHYEIQNIYPDITTGKLRTIYYPENESAEGTVAQGGTTDNENVDKALVLNSSTGVLQILSVDEWSVEEKTVDGETVLVGVIE